MELRRPTPKLRCAPSHYPEPPNDRTWVVDNIWQHAIQGQDEAKELLMQEYHQRAPMTLEGYNAQNL